VKKSRFTEAQIIAVLREHEAGSPSACATSPRAPPYRIP
jgi:hypothetical protein